MTQIKIDFVPLIFCYKDMCKKILVIKLKSKMFNDQSDQILYFDHQHGLGLKE